MGVPGRKSYFEELEIGKRYAQLTPKIFKVLQEHLESEDKKDNQWAVEQSNKALIKMIPQNLEYGGDNVIAPILVKIIGKDGDGNTNGV